MVFRAVVFRGWAVVTGGFKTVEPQEVYFGWVVLVVERRMEGEGRNWTIAKRTVGGYCNHLDLSLGKSKTQEG